MPDGSIHGAAERALWVFVEGCFGLSCCGGAEVHEFDLGYLLFSF